MDQSLVDASIAYHGSMLVDCFVDERVQVELPSFLTLTNHGIGKSDTPRDPDFMSKLNHFIVKRADIIFEKRIDSPTRKPTSRNKERPDDFVSLAPMETFMEVPGSDRRTHFMKCISIDAVVMGHVLAVQESGLLISVFSLDYGGARDIDRLGIMAFCPLSSLPRYYAHESPLEAFAIKDKVCGIVISFSADHENIVISMHSKALPSHMQHIQLGLVGDDELPSHYRQLQNVRYRSYQECLEDSKALANPLNVQHLCSYLGLDTTGPPASLLRAHRRASYAEEDYADKLRQSQSHRMALKSVAAGVACFKTGKVVEAMQHLNRALQVDPVNVEALVARGALYANSESFENAVDDFKEALKQNPHHKNARKYICETLVAQAKVVLEAGDEDEAVGLLKEVLRIDPCMDEANTTLFIIKNKRTMAEMKRRSSSGQPPDSQQADGAEVAMPNSMQETTDTLRRLIEDDKRQTRKRKRDSTSDGDSDSMHLSEQRRSVDGRRTKENESKEDLQQDRMQHDRQQVKLSTDSTSPGRHTSDMYGEHQKSLQHSPECEKISGTADYSRSSRSANLPTELTASHEHGRRGFKESSNDGMLKNHPKDDDNSEQHMEDQHQRQDRPQNPAVEKSPHPPRTSHEHSSSNYPRHDEDASRSASGSISRDMHIDTVYEHRDDNTSFAVQRSSQRSSDYKEPSQDRSRYSPDSGLRATEDWHHAGSVNSPSSMHSQQSSSHSKNTGDSLYYSTRQASVSERSWKLEQRHRDQSVDDHQSTSRSPHARRPTSYEENSSDKIQHRVESQKSSAIQLASTDNRRERASHSSSSTVASLQMMRTSSYDDDRSRHSTHDQRSDVKDHRSNDASKHPARSTSSSSSSEQSRSRSRHRHGRTSSSSSSSSSSRSRSRSRHRRMSSSLSRSRSRHRHTSSSSSRSRSRHIPQRSGSYSRTSTNLSFLFDAKRPAKRRHSSSSSSNSSSGRSSSLNRSRQKSRRRSDRPLTSSKLSFLFDSHRRSPKRRQRRSSSSDRSSSPSTRYSRRKSDHLVHSSKKSSRGSPKHGKRIESHGSEDRHQHDNRSANPPDEHSPSRVPHEMVRSDGHKQRLSSDSRHPEENVTSREKYREEKDYMQSDRTMSSSYLSQLKRKSSSAAAESYISNEKIITPSPMYSRRKSDELQHSTKQASLCDERDMQQHGKRTASQGSEERHHTDNRSTDSSKLSPSRDPCQSENYRQLKKRERSTNENDFLQYDRSISPSEPSTSSHHQQYVSEKRIVYAVHQPFPLTTSHVQNSDDEDEADKLSLKRKSMPEVRKVYMEPGSIEKRKKRKVERLSTSSVDDKDEKQRLIHPVSTDKRVSGEKVTNYGTKKRRSTDESPTKHETKKRHSIDKQAITLETKKRYSTDEAPTKHETKKRHSIDKKAITLETKKRYSTDEAPTKHETKKRHSIDEKAITLETKKRRSTDEKPTKLEKKKRHSTDEKPTKKKKRRSTESVERKSPIKKGAKKEKIKRKSREGANNEDDHAEVSAVHQKDKGDDKEAEQSHKTAAMVAAASPTSSSSSVHSRGLVSYQLSSDEKTSFGKWHSPDDDRSSKEKSKKPPISSPTISTSTPKDGARHKGTAKVRDGAKTETDSPKETLVEMENFLKMLKDKKKRSM